MLEILAVHALVVFILLVILGAVSSILVIRYKNAVLKIENTITYNQLAIMTNRVNSRVGNLCIITIGIILMNIAVMIYRMLV